MGTIVRRERYRRGLFGKIFKFFFILFHFLMVGWLISYWSAVGGLLKTGSDAERTGTGIGLLMGSGFLLVVWAAGAVILGLLTYFSRGEKIIIEEIQD